MVDPSEFGLVVKSADWRGMMLVGLMAQPWAASTDNWLAEMMAHMSEPTLVALTAGT